MSPFSIRRAKASDADTLAEFRFRLSVEDAIAEGRPPPRRNATTGSECRSWVVKGLRNRTLVRSLAESSGGSPVGMGYSSFIRSRYVRALDSGARFALRGSTRSPKPEGTV
jgi:hypothetical protein